MKILIIGFLVFAGWSAISTHIWVCNVLGLCNETETILTGNAGYKNTTGTDSMNNAVAPAKPVIPGDLMIYFEFDKSEFISDSLTERYYTASRSYLDNNSKAVINITGYTDSVGTDIYNQALGYRRAQTMQYFFTGKGLQADKILIGSKGETDPAAENKTVNGRANNRRAVITIKN
jgi:outer membrane protein OmpA-like peptidoglycan-associated protein